MTGFQRFLVHSLSDEGIVSECFKEGERLVDGIGDVQLRVYEMLKKSLFQGLGQGEHPHFISSLLSQSLSGALWPSGVDFLGALVGVAGSL